MPNLIIENDRTVADVETRYDEVNGGYFNNLYATANVKFEVTDDGSGYAELKTPIGKPFVVKGLYSDLKRHDLGPGFYERNFDGTLQTEFVTESLWGARTTAPYGHDGRSINLMSVIDRHGGEAQEPRDAFMQLNKRQQNRILAFLRSLVLFPPDDTASNLNPDNSATPGYPQTGHGSIKLPVLFNDPAESE